MFHIMMVCTGNICRSPMAEGLLSHYLPPDLKERVMVSSAGTHALQGYEAHDHAIEAMAKLGIDIQAHRARQLTREIARSADLILTMETAHLKMVKQTLGWGQSKPRLVLEFDHQSTATEVQDPYHDPFAAYEACVQTLRPCIKGINLWLGNNI